MICFASVAIKKCDAKTTFYLQSNFYLYKHVLLFYCLCTNRTKKQV